MIPFADELAKAIQHDKRQRATAQYQAAKSNARHLRMKSKGFKVERRRTGVHR